MVDIGIKKKIQEFTNFVLVENKISIINIKLILNSLYYTVRAYLLKERNIASEIYSYESLLFIKKKDPIGFLESCRRNDNAFPEGIINEVLNIKENVFKVESLLTLEIGSGPNSNLSYWVDNGILKVIGIDPLADIYKNIMKKLKYKYPITPINIKAENLMKHFKEDSFHIVFAQNSLDHVEDPLLCFKNAYHLLKKRGFLFVCSNVKEGTRKLWLGMHKFDIYIENDELLLANKKGQIFKFINDDMSLELIFYESYFKNDIASFEAVFKKN